MVVVPGGEEPHELPRGCRTDLGVLGLGEWSWGWLELDGVSWAPSSPSPPGVRLRAEIAEAVSSLGAQLPLAGAGVVMGTLGGVGELEGKQLAKPE